MAGRALLDAGFVVALLSRRDAHHRWAVAQTPRLAPPWDTCEAVLSEAFHLLGARGTPGLSALLRRRAVVVAFDFANDLEPVLKLMQKYANVPMSLADACLVHMTEMRSDPVILTTDTDFRIYRRHGRQVFRACCHADRSATGVKLSPKSQNSQRLAHGMGSQAITRVR